jgi:hypothetical protein
MKLAVSIILLVMLVENKGKRMEYWGTEWN